MRKFFGAFSKLDWVTFILCGVLVLLTLVPLLPFAQVTDHWFLTAIIALGAVTLSAIVLSQIESREADKAIAARMGGVTVSRPRRRGSRFRTRGAGAPHPV